MTKEGSVVSSAVAGLLLSRQCGAITDQRTHQRCNADERCAETPCPCGFWQPILAGPHPIMQGVLDDMQRTYARMAKTPQTRGVCRCQRFAFPHRYEPDCAIVAALESDAIRQTHADITRRRS